MVNHLLPSVTTPYHWYHQYQSTMFLRAHHQANTHHSQMVNHLLPSITACYHWYRWTMFLRGHHLANTHHSLSVNHLLPSVTTPYHWYRSTMFFEGPPLGQHTSFTNGKPSFTIRHYPLSMVPSVPIDYVF